MERDIFQRQRLIAGWEQERLTQARVAIVGSDWLAGYCALILACLGVGRIYLLDDARANGNERFFFPLPPLATRASGWANWLAALGFSNRIIARCVNPLYGERVLLPPVDAVVSATGDPNLQQALIRYAGQANVPLVAGGIEGAAGGAA